MLRLPLLLLLVGGLVTVTGCGESSNSSRTTGPTPTSRAVVTTDEAPTVGHDATPEELLVTLRQIGPLLDSALEQYRAGKRKAAANTVVEIYSEQFEKVQRALGERNHGLESQLDHQLSRELREGIEDGKSLAELKALVAEIKTGIAQARHELA